MSATTQPGAGIPRNGFGSWPFVPLWGGSWPYSLRPPPGLSMMDAKAVAPRKCSNCRRTERADLNDAGWTVAGERTLCAWCSPHPRTPLPAKREHWPLHPYGRWLLQRDRILRIARGEETAEHGHPEGLCELAGCRADDPFLLAWVLADGRHEDYLSLLLRNG